MRTLLLIPLALALGACRNSTQFYVGGDTGDTVAESAAASDHGSHSSAPTANRPAGIGLLLGGSSDAAGAAPRGAPHGREGQPAGDHAGQDGSTRVRMAPATGTDHGDHAGH